MSLIKIMFFWGLIEALIVANQQLMMLFLSSVIRGFPMPFFACVLYFYVIVSTDTSGDTLGAASLIARSNGI